MKVAPSILVGLHTWFVTIWPNRDQRSGLAQQYALVGSQKLFMRDLALRCGLLAPSPPDASSYQAGFEAGRRSIGLEIIHTCRNDPLVLMDLAPAAKPKEP